jgi:hypothetical protein
MSKLVRKHASFLHLLGKSGPKQRKSLLMSADKNAVKCLCEIANNVCEGRVPLSAKQVSKLRRVKKYMRILADKRKPLESKKKLLIQHGGFLPALIAPLASLVGGLISGAFS